MDNTFKIENAVAAIRISSTKQGLQGDSPQAQKEQIEQFAKVHNINVKKFFIFMESASKEEQPVQEAIDYCKNPKNDIQLFIIKSIDRFTRGGSYLYDHMKMQLTRYGVKLIDIYGIISNHEVNTLEHLGLQYDWSVYSPTKKSEILEAERAKDEIRDILSRMIGAEIRYMRLGYRVRPAPFGYMNEKVETPHGRRCILIPHPEESKWIIRMFELRIRGTMVDQKIVDEINNLGYKSRKLYIRNPNDRTQIIGDRGGKQLTLKQFWRFIEQPIYTGINWDKWTQDQPVKGQFKGLISYEMFNQANRGKSIISEENGQIKIEKRKPQEWRLKKSVKNPDFPYKRYIMCPECEKPLFGSRSKGRSKYYPAYHCNKRGHHFRVSAPQLDETVHTFVKGLHITQQYIDTLKTQTLEEWKRRMSETKSDVSEVDKKIEELRKESQAMRTQIRKMSIESVIKDIEVDILKLENDIETLEGEKNKKEGEVINMEVVIDNVEYYLASLENLLLGSPDPLKRAAYFGVLFQTAPTYQELVSGTAKLEPCIALNEDFFKTNSQTVSRLGIEPRTKRLKVSCSTAELPARILYC